MSRIEAKQYVKERTVAIEMGFMDSGDILEVERQNLLIN